MYEYDTVKEQIIYMNYFIFRVRLAYAGNSHKRQQQTLNS
jgi:hypothetical protein